jgi:uncharacterized protein YbjT (DUF2867 family)
MKAIVIGATGTIGKGIVDELVSNGWEVISGHRNSIVSIDIDNARRARRRENTI